MGPRWGILALRAPPDPPGAHCWRPPFVAIGRRVGAALARAPRRWIGPLTREADDAFRRARVHGMSLARACVVGQIASFKDGWMPRHRIAELVGVCVRTVQRGITQARELGMMRTARSKPRERPPGAQGPFWCGFSHRWIIPAVSEAAAAASHLARQVARKMAGVCAGARPCTPRRERTPGELAERAARAKSDLAALVTQWETEAKPPPKRA